MNNKSLLRQFSPILITAILAASFVLVYFSTAFGSDGTAKSSSRPGTSAAKFDFKKYEGKYLVFLLYSIDAPLAAEAVKLMNEVYGIRREYNFEVVGISLNPDKFSEVQKFNRANNISFPVFADQNKEMYSMLKMRGNLGLFVFNKRGRMMGGSYAPKKRNLADIWRGQLSRYLKIGYVPEDKPILGIKPQVPLFEGIALDGKIIRIKDIYKTKPVVIVIFSPKCKNCRKELDFLNGIYTNGELKGKFEIVAISILDKKTTAQLFHQRKYSFPAIADRHRRIASLFPSFIGPVPTSVVVDQEGRINALHTGFIPNLVDIYIMNLKKLAGLPNPPLLIKSGYSGEQRCGICHEKEHIQWSLSRHSNAFLSLVRKGKEKDESCIACHVTGFGQEGGYKLKKRTRHLEGVQCESCHGPGYQSCTAFNAGRPIKRNAAEWEKLCLTCHTAKESLNFVFNNRFPKVFHSNMPDITTMDRNERLDFIRKFREKMDLFDNQAKYVGAEACRECHQEEYDHWGKTLHSGVHKTIKAQSAPPDETFRFNTGTGSPGGYPVPGREGVQCEACHGPGEKHLADPEAKGHNYIVGLGAECASCVVEQICRGCHTLKNDPDFNFEKQIEEVRHKPQLISDPTPKGTP